MGGGGTVVQKYYRVLYYSTYVPQGALPWRWLHPEQQSLCCSVTETHSILWSADCQHSDGEEEWLTVIITCCINNTVLREAVKNCLNVLPLRKDKWRGRGFSGGVARDSCPTDTNTPWERGFICKQQLLHTNTFFLQLKSDDAGRYQRRSADAVVHLRSLLSSMD